MEWCGCFPWLWRSFRFEGPVCASSSIRRIVFSVDPSLLVVPVTVHIGVNEQDEPVVDDATVREWFGEFRIWDMTQSWSLDLPTRRWRRVYAEYWTERPWRMVSAPGGLSGPDMGRPMERVDVVFGQCRVAFEVEVVHHEGLIAASDRHLLDSSLVFPSGEVRSRAIPGRVNVFVGGLKTVGDWGLSWQNIDRIAVVSLQAIERASLGFGARRVLAHEVGHDLGLTDDWSADTTNLMNVMTPPRGGVALDSGQCAAVRREAESLAVPAAKTSGSEP